MTKLIKLPRRVWEKIKPKPERIVCPACGSSVLPKEMIEERGYVGCKRCVT